MCDPLWLIPALPLAGFLALTAGQRLSRRAIACIGVGSVGAAAVVALVTAVRFVGAPPAGGAVRDIVWTWMHVGDFAPRIAFYLDALSLVMTLVVTGVGFLIHLYSAAFMAGQGEPAGEGYRRFFAYMNLFVSAMLILVLADDLLLLYLGWEGVGLCSYLLIGFWYKPAANGQAAIKAFVVTRVGDTAMAVALFLAFLHLGTLQIQELLRRAAEQWTPGTGVAVAVAALLLAGAVGKSAQLPLQTWLPDAMAGPTPVSALIHAATMVTAGVYLIARTHVLFELAPVVQRLVATIGAVTLLLAACSAVVQRDIKRVLAYSTMSQVGYMFLALGVGAWSAAMVHFATHALFKSLLFLGAGVVIAALDEEHDMFKMGGLRRRMPVTFWTFVAGALALAALPPATAGFSKELILSSVWCSSRGGPWLFAAGIAGVFLTSLYTFRMVFLTFFGEPHGEPRGRLGVAMGLPLIVLAAGCLLGGWVLWPGTPGGRPFLGSFLSATFGQSAIDCPPRVEWALGAVSMLAALAGVGVAYGAYLHRATAARGVFHSVLAAAIHRLWFTGWGFDWIYGKVFVQPFVVLARLNRADAIDRIYAALAGLNRGMHGVLGLTQNGRVRWYAAGLIAGAIVLLAIACRH